MPIDRVVSGRAVDPDDGRDARAPVQVRRVQPAGGHHGVGQVEALVLTRDLEKNVMACMYVLQ